MPCPAATLDPDCSARCCRRAEEAVYSQARVPLACRRCQRRPAIAAVAAVLVTASGQAREALAPLPPRPYGRPKAAEQAGSEGRCSCPARHALIPSSAARQLLRGGCARRCTSSTLHTTLFPPAQTKTLRGLLAERTVVHPAGETGAGGAYMMVFGSDKDKPAASRAACRAASQAGGGGAG